LVVSGVGLELLALDVAALGAGDVLRDDAVPGPEPVQAVTIATSAPATRNQTPRNPAMAVMMRHSTLDLLCQ
jgi:hypothetical protein